MHTQIYYSKLVNNRYNAILLYICKMIMHLLKLSKNQFVVVRRIRAQAIFINIWFVACYSSLYVFLLQVSHHDRNIHFLWGQNQIIYLDMITILRYSLFGYSSTDTKYHVMSGYPKPLCFYAKQQIRSAMFPSSLGQYRLLLTFLPIQ